MKQNTAYAAPRRSGIVGLASLPVTAFGNSRNISSELQKASELIARTAQELREKRGRPVQWQPANILKKNEDSAAVQDRHKYPDPAPIKSRFERPQETSRQDSSPRQFGMNYLAGESYRNPEMLRPTEKATTYLPNMPVISNDKNSETEVMIGLFAPRADNVSVNTVPKQVITSSTENIVGAVKEKSLGHCEISTVSLQIARLTEEVIKLRQSRHGRVSIITKERALVEKAAAQPKQSQLSNTAADRPTTLKPVTYREAAADTGPKKSHAIHVSQNTTLPSTVATLAETLSQGHGSHLKHGASKRSHYIETPGEPEASCAPAILSRRDMTSVLFRLVAILLLIGVGEGIRRVVSYSSEQKIIFASAQKAPVSANLKDHNSQSPLISDRLPDPLSPSIQSVAVSSADLSGPKKQDDEWRQAFSKQLERLEGRSFEAALATGNPRALFDKAIYFAELGDDASLAEAALLFSQAAEKEFVPAQFRLGVAFEKGLGVLANKTKAASLYSRAALGGNVKAMHNLATLLASGLPGSKPDYTQAAQWFLSAAERGLADSQYNYALLALRGTGIPRSSSDAFKYMSLAARQGDADAVARRDQIAQLFSKAEIESIEQDIIAFNVKMESAEANEKTLPPSPWLEHDWVTQRWFKRNKRQG